MDFSKVIQERRSVKKYDQNVKMTKDEIEKIIEIASLSPSAWNLQQWHYLIVTDEDKKQQLQKCAWNQPKVSEASASIVVLGDLHAYERAGEVAEEWAQKGYVPADGKKGLVDSIYSFYENDQTKRDEAIRGASLAAMSLMLTAKDMGYATCPMIGFDPEAIRKEFNIPQNLIPALMITLGKGEESRERASRRSPKDIITYETF
ncbi:nitroreductase family protein [Terrilactibacillus sp. BCM23-1]|uniref:Nitroreductase family protein n=1 Tax=Terrilactibacillus tamarindi TaxID=2599694 RepID=A0A6N8CMG1_9BACI|nr:nitroreductase family protein [Terrilactibacillus tamarindi]MTT30680.1 nitroreductase family protein [Terrilactibacillus tamarindi]